MPTERRRYQITETDDVARALDSAAARWPGEPRSRLLVRVIAAGELAMSKEADVAAHREAIIRVAGSATGQYPENYLRDLRGDWPQ